MKIFIIFLLLLISPIELFRHNDEIDDLINLLNTDHNYKHRPNKQNFDDQNDDDDDDEQDSPLLYERKKFPPSRKKIFDENDVISEESENNDIKNKIISSTTASNQHDLTDTLSCTNKFDIKPEQLVKVKELENGAHMIQHILIDKRLLSLNMNIRDSCMLKCCEEKTCDLAMLSEQPTHDGYKCYLFACNGSCILASHQDYTIMTPKKDSAFYPQSITINVDVKSTSTISNVIVSQKKSYFHETAVIIFLVLGLLCTIILFVILCCYCRKVRTGRRLKNYAVDADYLINGLYL